MSPKGTEKTEETNGGGANGFLPTTTGKDAAVAAEQALETLPIVLGGKGVQLTSLDEMYRFAKCVVLSGLAPKGMSKVETVMIAIQMGLELGLTPMSALQNIGVINGVPSIFGDAALALVRASGLLEDFWEVIRGDGDARVAICFSKRKGYSKGRETSFSVDDAKQAKLWMRKGRDGQSTPWVTYPERMLQWRARGFNLRDNFGDVLKGLKTTEEVQDMVRVDGERVEERTGPTEMPPDDDADDDADAKGPKLPSQEPETAEEEEPASAPVTETSSGPGDKLPFFEGTEEPGRK